MFELKRATISMVQFALLQDQRVTYLAQAYIALKSTYPRMIACLGLNCDEFVSAVEKFGLEMYAKHGPMHLDDVVQSFLATRLSDFFNVLTDAYPTLWYYFRPGSYKYP